ncbi:hypothetical protein Rmet_6587 [Cupriavidus metallidurans CH34]|uniref:Uncharacterized protein n=1 Tax=Cupriavidus metallidurans (strain ATCC 43123 / DSM 2839 / NBRC 102507 / CH34) TaxID=266264 RepID=D3DY18_CUPMC|nr:hypothetical protein Rmet_6587 [Cupriavidus metallidurans CH34]
MKRFALLWSTILTKSKGAGNVPV